MATDLQIAYEAQALTADGGSNGRLTVTSTAKLRKGARILLRSSAVDAVELVIDSIDSATVIEVRDPSVTGACLFNCSAYLVVDTATVTQNPQVDYYASSWLRF